MRSPLSSFCAMWLFLAVGAGCGSDDDDDDDVVTDGEPDAGGGEIVEFLEEPSFATASPTCPSPEAESRIVFAGVGAAAAQPAAPERSRVVFARSSSPGARDAARPPPSASPPEAGLFYLHRTYPRALAAPARLAAVHERGGATIVKYRQDVDGVPVFRKEVTFILGRDRRLVAVSGELSTSPAADAGTRADEAAFDSGARSAIAAAARDLGIPVTAGQLTRGGQRGAFVEWRPASGHAITTARARRVYFDDGSSLLPSFHVELMGRFRGAPGPELRSAVVGARGDILFRNNKTHHAEPFAYRVYGDAASLEPAISPFCDQGVPHPTGVPDGFIPEEPCSQELVSLIQAGIPTGDPWLPDDATDTHGNNVDAFFHIQTGDDFEFFEPDFAPERDFRAQVTALREFDHPYDVTLAPMDYFENDDADPPQPAPDPTDPQLNAKIVHGFYLGNYLHDLMYAHGYDEASGNSQLDNYGRGGLGGDPLLVHAGSFGTYTIAPADGSPPVLTMGLAFATQLNRDATLDLMIFGHEWMHTMQHRLIGDSEGLANIQGRSLGEGWSDFFGLLLAIRPTQAAAPANPNWTGVFGLGPYYNQSYCQEEYGPLGVPCNGIDDVYYFGIRRYPFTVDKTKSPLTFRYIANGIELPSGIPQRFWKLRIENAEIHSAGEIWASALWGSYRALLLDERYTFDEAKGRMLDYLVANMKATPLDPTFLEARDALLAVVRAADEKDYRSFRRAFAERGMGAGALAPARDSNDLKGAIESMREEGPALSFVSASLDDRMTGDADGRLDVGETGVLTVRLRNTGFDDLGDTRVRVAAVGGHSDVTDGEEVVSAAPGEDITLEFPVTLREAEDYDVVQFDVTFSDDAADLAPTTVRAGFHVHYDVVNTSTDSVEPPISQGDWFMETDVPWSETVWARVPSGDDHAYELRGTRLDRAASLITRCVQASMSENLVIRFDQEYRLAPYASVGVRTAGSPEFYWEPVYSIPFDSTEGMGPVEVDLQQQYAGQWLQFRFFGYMPPATESGVPLWSVDDIEIAGVESGPFSGVVPQGEAAGSP